MKNTRLTLSFLPKELESTGILYKQMSRRLKGDTKCSKVPEQQRHLIGALALNAENTFILTARFSFPYFQIHYSLSHETFSVCLFLSSPIPSTYHLAWISKILSEWSKWKTGQKLLTLPLPMSNEYTRKEENAEDTHFIRRAFNSPYRWKLSFTTLNYTHTSRTFYIVYMRWEQPMHHNLETN